MGLPTWEQSVHNAPLHHFERVGGSQQWGIRTVVGIPVASPNVGRIVVVLYSRHDRPKDHDLVIRITDEFTKLLPSPKWKLVVDVGVGSNSGGGQGQMTSQNHQPAQSQSQQIQSQQAQSQQIQPQYQPQQQMQNQQVHQQMQNQQVQQQYVPAQQMQQAQLLQQQAQAQQMQVRLEKCASHATMSSRISQPNFGSRSCSSNSNSPALPRRQAIRHWHQRSSQFSASICRPILPTRPSNTFRAS